MNHPVDFSVVVPAYNEGELIRNTYLNVVEAIPAGKTFEVLLINDASQDDTGAIADAIAAECEHCQALHNPRNLNLGGSYKRGVELARGEYVIMVPGDNSFPADSIRAMLEEAGKADIIIQYHANMDDYRAAYRTVISKSFTATMNLTFGLRLPYYNGIVLHRTDILRTIEIKTGGFFYQAEALVKLLKKGHSFEKKAVIVCEHAHEHDERTPAAIKPKNIINVARDFLRLVKEIYLG